MEVSKNQRPPRRSVHIPLAAWIIRFNRSLTSRDRAIVIALIAVLVLATGLLVRQSILGHTFGRRASFTEGIVASSLTDVDPTVQALTHSALLMADPAGALTGQLAESWKVSDDAKTFEFSLRAGVDRAVVLDALNPKTPGSPVTGATVEPFGERGVRLTLGQPLAPFIAEATQPVVPIGPYVIADRTKDHVTLVGRPDYVLGAPTLDTITLDIFPTTSELQRALDRHAIDGVANVTSDLKLPSSFVSDTLTLPRTTAAFFNLQRSVVQDLGRRQQLIDRKPFGTPLPLTVVTSDLLAATPDVQRLLADWRAANVQLTLVTLTTTDLQPRIASRDYDVLIDGINLGADPDPYPFWDSSQRKDTGLNLSNFANVDADKLLEAARTTGSADQRATLYQQFNQILDQQKPWLVLNHAPSVFATDRNLTGPSSHTGFTPTDRYADVQHWHWK